MPLKRHSLSGCEVDFAVELASLPSGAPQILRHNQGSCPAKSSNPKKGDFAVKRKRFSVEQIVAVLKQAEVGVPVAELIRQVGITEQTLYRWKKQYKGLETDQVRQFKQIQEENSRLKHLVAELTLDKAMPQDVLSKKL